MSSWTDVLLTASGLEDSGPEDGPEQYIAIEQINSWLRANGLWDLFLVAPPRQDQHSPASCFAGTFKSLNRDKFIEAVSAAPWAWKEQVQLFLREEDDKGFREIRLV